MPHEAAAALGEQTQRSAAGAACVYQEDVAGPRARGFKRLGGFVCSTHRWYSPISRSMMSCLAQTSFSRSSLFIVMFPAVMLVSASISCTPTRHCTPGTLEQLQLAQPYAGYAVRIGYAAPAPWHRTGMDASACSVRSDTVRSASFLPWMQSTMHAASRQD